MNVIYKIMCRNPDVKDIYIGSTKHHKSRESNHRHCAHNPESKLYNTKLYKKIRENGGWHNWTIQHLEICRHGVDIKAREKHYYNELKPTLNTCSPLRLDNEYIDYKREYYKQYYRTNKDQYIARYLCKRNLNI